MRDLPDRVDVLVVGGGPAGSTAACQLARRGYDVVLIDKQHHPRETVGESVLPSSWKYFDLLGATQAIEQCGFVRKAGGVVAWGDQITQIAFSDFEYDRPGLHVERDEMDYVLLNNARSNGVRVFEGYRAETVLIGSDGGATVTIAGNGEQQQIVCRFLIDASGQASLMARQLGARRLNPDFRFAALWGYFKDSRFVAPTGVVHPFADLATHAPSTFVTGLGDWGWSWHIPLKRYTSVGLVIPIEDYKRNSEAFSSLNDYYLATCRAAPYLGALLEGAELTNGGIRVMRDFSYVSDVLSGPGFLIIGDAAGFVDPIFSIGFTISLYSGNIAAWAVDRALRQPAREAGARAVFEKQMLGRYQLAHTMALPGVDAAATDAAKSHFNFFSRSEKELMWAASSMTTRSDNLVRASGDAGGAPVLKRRVLDGLQFS
jgi:flavin-dependent dehydrogenase